MFICDRTCWSSEVETRHFPVWPGGRAPPRRQHSCYISVAMTAKGDVDKKELGNGAIAPIWANEVLSTPQLLGILPTAKFWLGRKRANVTILNTLKLIFVMVLQSIPFVTVATLFASIFPAFTDTIGVVAVLLFHGTVEKVARARLKEIYRPALTSESSRS